MKKPVFTGSSAAIVTPMHPDGSVNFGKLAELIEFQITNGTAAITVCGTTGEAATLADEEQKQLIDFTVKQVAGRIPVIAGTGSNDTHHAIALSRTAQSCGADGLLVVTPYYNKCTQKGLVKHYEALADTVDIPIILYNVPSRTGVSISLPSCRALAEHPGINGIKEASGNTDVSLQIRVVCKDDLHIWSGNDSQIVPLMALGAKGVISVLANLCPKTVADITKLCLRGDYKQAAGLQVRYSPLVDALFSEVNPVPIKAAMNFCDMNVGPLRMPLCEIGAAAKETLENTLKDYHLM